MKMFCSPLKKCKVLFITNVMISTFVMNQLKTFLLSNPISTFPLFNIVLAKQKGRCKSPPHWLLCRRWGSSCCALFTTLFTAMFTTLFTTLLQVGIILLCIVYAVVGANTFISMENPAEEERSIFQKLKKWKLALVLDVLFVIMLRSQGICFIL